MRAKPYPKFSLELIKYIYLNTKRKRKRNSKFNSELGCHPFQSSGIENLIF